MKDAFAQKFEKIQPCDPQTISFFKLIESIWEDPNNQPFHRFCTLMRKMKACSFVREELILNQELLDEREMLQVHLGSNVVFTAERLTFFASLPESLEWSDPKQLPESHILGYAVIVKVMEGTQHKITFMLESVVRPPSVVFLLKDDDIFIEGITNYYLHNSRPFETILGTREKFRTFIFPGSFFTQQNGLTSVCAHAALRTAVNSSGMLNVQKLTNKYINDSLNLSDYNPHGGLDRKQIERVVQSLGLHFHSANFLENTAIEYDHFMYPSLESGFPTILGLERWDADSKSLSGHVVTVLGHTMNSDRWEPEARRGYGNYPITPYIPTAEWCCHYIISDDNYGMYSTLPTDAVRNFIVPAKNPNQHVSMAISIVPSDVMLPGYHAEQLAMYRAIWLINNVNLKRRRKWHERMRGKNNHVCRTLLIAKDDYLKFIRTYNSKITEEQNKYLDALPKYVWVSEVSLPDIFTGNKHKLGDVVVRANATPQEHINGESLVLAWFPGFVQLGHQLNWKEGWAIETHIPLFRYKEPPLLEW
jgi:hypothetical protein